jgi:hypothetical protein
MLRYTYIASIVKCFKMVVLNIRTGLHTFVYKDKKINFSLRDAKASGEFGDTVPLTYVDTRIHEKKNSEIFDCIFDFNVYGSVHCNNILT